MATPLPTFCEEELIIHSNLEYNGNFGCWYQAAISWEKTPVGYWVFDNTVTNARQARDDDLGESTSPYLYDNLFIASSHTVKVFFFSFEDKLFDRVIGTPFRMGKICMGALLLESYGTMLIEVAATNGNDFCF